MAQQNLFEQLKSNLEVFNTFLDDNVSVIKPAVQALDSLVPQITDLISSLADLLNSLKTEIQNLDVGAIANLDKVSQFTGNVTNILQTSTDLLPNLGSEIESVLSIANVVSGLPSLDEIKTEIIGLLDAIIVHINSLKS